MNATRLAATGKEGILTVSGEAAGSEANTDASNRELRNFGLVLGGLLAAAFGLVIPLLHRRAMPWWPWAPAIMLVAAALIRPSLLHYFHLGWSRLGLALGWLNSRVLLGALFYVVITPVGLLRQLISWRRSGEGAMRQPESYRVQSRQVSREGFEKPF